MIRALIFLVTLLLVSTSYATQVAISIDDPNVEVTPLFDSTARDQKILNALKKNNLKIIIFICGMRVDNPEGHALLSRWDNAHQIIGNHTYSHKSYNDMSYEQEVSDFMRNEKLISPYKNFKKIFRFPFLKEGDTLEKREKFRKFLHDRNYKNGAVSIDASDWYISQRLEAKLAKNPHADISGYKKYYLDHVWSRAQYYDNLAKQVLHRSPKHVLLLHHNLLNALFLDDLINMFKQKGWKVIDTDTAYRDPMYNYQPNIIPMGESLVWAIAKETGKYDAQLRYPGEDDVYEKEPMDKLGL